VKENLYIELGEIATNYLDLSIIDMQGRVVHTDRINVNNKQHTLSLGELSAGTYMLRLQNDRAAYTQQIIHE
jgi:hypothetical protein